MVSVAATGAALGVAVQVYANAVSEREGQGEGKERTTTTMAATARVHRRSHFFPHQLTSSVSLRPPQPQIRKLPALHQPWLHVAWGAAGAAGAGALVAWTEKAGAEVDAEVAARAAANRSASAGRS